MTCNLCPARLIVTLESKQLTSHKGNYRHQNTKHLQRLHRRISNSN